ncbi:MAG: hypothetical protein ABGZ31_04330 [Roseibacillus sp.]
MTRRIMRALGLDVGEVDRIADWSLRWETAQWGILAAVLMGGLSFLSWELYRRSPRELPGGRRFLLAMLRMIFLGLVIAIFLQPVVVLTLEKEVPRTLPILVDRSGSMSLREPDGVSRLQKAQGAFSSPNGQEMLRSLKEDMRVPTFTFHGSSLREWEELELPLVAAGEKTAVGEAVRKVLERYRGAPLAGVLVVSDGGQNSGVSLGAVARQLKESGVALYTVGVGDPKMRDVAVEKVEVREVLLADDAVPVTVKFRTQGMRGDSGRIVFTLSGVDVAEEKVRIEADGLQQATTLFVPKQEGEYVMEARFEVDDGVEALAENNTGRAGLRVVDRRLKVLLLDQAPRWEFKYLEAMLLRERRVDLSCFLFEGDREVARIPGSPYLEQFPARAEDLFDFDLILLGDIDPRLLTEDRLSLLGDYVATAGGALTVIAGKRFMPSAFARTELEQLLPVEFAGASLGSAKSLSARPLRLNLTPAGRESVMLRLGDEPQASEALWSNLPPIYWAAGVQRAKPAAEVLLTRPDQNSASGAAPVLALHRYGAGEVLFVGTDNFWRFRRNVGDRYHTILWGQIIQRMAGARLLTEAPRVTLRSNGRHFEQGDRVQVYARLFTASWDPREDERVEAVLAAGDDPDRREDVILRAIPSQPGMYRAELSAGPPGNYRLAVAGDEIATLDFTVTDNNREYARASLNEGLLRDLSRDTGGAYLPLARLKELPAAITDRSARLTSLREIELWSSPLFFGLIILILAAEWIVRKISELK